MVKDIVGAADELKGSVETLKAGLNRHVRSFNSACAPALQRIDAVLAQLQVRSSTQPSPGAATRSLMNSPSSTALRR
jgi:hypothetical protein